MIFGRKYLGELKHVLISTKKLFQAHVVVHCLLNNFHNFKYILGFLILSTLISDLFLWSLQTFYSNLNSYEKVKRMGLFPCTSPTSVYTTFKNIYLSNKQISLHLYFNFISLIISEKNSNVFKSCFHITLLVNYYFKSLHIFILFHVFLPISWKTY